MFYPLVLYIGLRYTCSKRRNHFISFISLASMVGIALGVTVLITVLSVMNGFDYEIHQRIFNMAEQVKITGANGGIKNWQKLQSQAIEVPRVIAASPFVSGQGMINNAGLVSGVVINGIEPTLDKKVLSVDSSMTEGSMDKLKAGSFGIVLGWDLAMQLGLKVGDKVMLITPQATLTPVGVLPRFKRFTVMGIFHVGGGFGYDTSVVFMHLQDAQKLLEMDDTVTGVRLKVRNLYDAPWVAEHLANILPADYLITDWTKDYGTYFRAIQMEKTTMFVVLMFIIAVAAFNLVSSLVMTVTDKRSDIAILRTLGASPRTIMSIFMVQGSIIGIIGTIIGVIGGVLLALNAPRLVQILEHYLHTHFISDTIYFINYLPSRLVLSDVVHVGAITLVMSFLATLYPAWRASKTQPAEALRYE